MDAIRLQNIRSLADTGLIQLRPITLLLGQNSSGKSTVLRSLPLLAQSIRTRTNAPILWYGESVDFGSVEEVRSTFATDSTVKLEFDMGEIAVRSRTYQPGLPQRMRIPFRIQIELDAVEGRTRFKSFEITSGRDRLQISVEQRGTASRVLFNNEDFTRLLPPDRYRLTTTGLVPQLNVRTPAEDGSISYYDPYRRSVDTAQREIRRLLGSRLHGRSSEESIAALARRIRYRPAEEFAATLADIVTPLKSWKALAKTWAGLPFSSEIENLRALSMIAWLPDILWSLDRELRDVAESISYIGPSRATGERYYRIQELAVDQIDPQGKNLAMFLDSLTRPQLRSFSHWLAESIGYSLDLSRSTGHVQINLRARNSDRFYNIADMGYGFSQVLPIMAQIWGRRTTRSPLSDNRLFAMEQPELHLHPAYQARLADVFVNAIQPRSSNRTGVRFLIETHSEALINRLGELVYEQAINADQIALYVFEKQVDDDVTHIRSVNFESDGTLSNWPIGFFSSEFHR